VQVVVGRVVRPHGVRGEAAVDPRTDRPEQRFAPGQVLATPHGRTLTVLTSRPHASRWLLRFEGVDDRDDVDALRGTDLLVDVAGETAEDDEDVFADLVLVGLAARSRSGDVLGEVSAVEHLPMQDLLLVRTPDGRDVRVPFVAAIVPRVDVDAGWLLVDPPSGLFDEDAP
jgi:16S rRNA processing protein RimM